MTFRLSFFLFSALLGAVLAVGAVFYLQNNSSVSSEDETVADFALIDQSGHFHQLYNYAYAKAVVLYVHAIGCPVVANDIPALKQLKNQFGEKNIEFFAINANFTDDRASLAALTDSLGFDIPILMDDSQLVIEELGVMRAGELIVLDPKTWTIRYRGSMGAGIATVDANKNLGNQYLADVLTALSEDKSIALSNRPSKGCLIDFIDDPASHHKMISYAQEVEPILRNRCVACHRQGGIGPWAMDSHATLKAWAPRVRQAIMNRSMPPWHADPKVGKFAFDRSLTVEQQRTLVHWIDQGAPAGLSPDPLAQIPPKPVENWPLGEPDLVVKLPTVNIPAEGIFAWQFKKVPLPITKDKWVRAVHLKPSNKEATHHVFAFVEYPKEAKEHEPDWGQGANSFFAAYVPGMSVNPFPHNSGQFLPKGSVVSFQRHYITVGYPTEDDLELALYFHKEPPQVEYKMVSAINMGINIPPYASKHREFANVTLKEEGELHAIYPHMHYRGKAMQFAAHYPDGTQEQLLSVPNYDFNWQTTYQLQQPKWLPAGTKVSVDAEFDNSVNNPVNPNPASTVKWGMLSDDEMLVGYLVYTTRLSQVHK